MAGSLGGISVRLAADASLWQMAAFRYLTVALLVFLFCWYEHRRKVFRAYGAIGWAGVAAGLLLACHHLSYVAAMMDTTVANAAFALATAPVMSALLGVVFLRERLRPLGWIAIAGAVAGVGVMVGGGLSGQGLFGVAMAGAAALAFAGYIVLVRAARRADMVPSMSLGAVLAGAAGLLLSDAGLDVSARDAAVMMGLGAGQTAVATILVVLAARHIRAAEVNLLMMTETVLGPVWAWFALREMPDTATLMGGAVVLISVGGFAAVSLRDVAAAKPARTRLS